MARGVLSRAVIALLLCSATAAQADPDLELKVNRVWATSYGSGKALVTLRNHTAQTFDAEVKCVYLLRDEPVFIGIGLTENLRPGEADTFEILSNENGKFDNAKCEVEKTWPH